MEDYESNVEIIEHQITPTELQEIFNNMTIEELYDELPIKNIYKDFENFNKELELTQGDTLLEKFCKLTIKKCKERIDYLEDKKGTLDICDVNTYDIEQIIRIENEALDYFKSLFLTN